MAERRMFAKTLIDSDFFLELPLSAQALYFHLAMRADDDGFINNPKKIQRMIGATDGDCKMLIFKRLLLCFDTGVIVIRHWRIHNYIQKDRYRETIYLDEKNTLALDESNAYTEIKNVSDLDTGCIQSVSKMDTQVRLGKVSKESKKEEKNNNTNNSAHACACESYESVIADMELEDEVKPMLWSFIKHCQLNKRTLTNDKLTNILFEMDKQRLTPGEKIQALQNAINGGYYDIKR